MKKILVATKNRGKIQEIEKLLQGLPFEVCSLLDFSDTEEVEETGFTFRENASIKALDAYQKYKIPSLADDSGISIHYLNDFPGVLSARFLSNKDYSQKNQWLIELMSGVADRNAKYQCVLAYADESGVHYFEGECSGRIAEKPSGTNGFGYDPIFYYPPEGKTMAELDLEIKNRISHRGIALRKWVKSLAEN